MIMYNTVIGVAVGAALILVPRYWAAVRGEHIPLRLVRDPVEPGGCAAAFGVLGRRLARADARRRRLARLSLSLVVANEVRRLSEAPRRRRCGSMAQR